MYCPKCGTENTNNASICIECNHELNPVREPHAAPPPHMAQPQMAGQPVGSVPNYLVQAILLTLFCCIPFGIVAIVYAAQVNGKLAVGDIYGATEASNKAKMWCWWAFGLGLVFRILIPIIWFIIVIGAGMAGGGY